MCVCGDVADACCGGRRGVGARQNDSGVSGSRGNGNGPRVHTGIVTPPPSLLPSPTTNSGGTAVLSSQLLHRPASLTATTYLLSPLSPKRKLVSSLCTCIYARMYVLVRARVYM